MFEVLKNNVKTYFEKVKTKKKLTVLSCIKAANLWTSFICWSTPCKGVSYTVTNSGTC